MTMLSFKLAVFFRDVRWIDFRRWMFEHRFPGQIAPSFLRKKFYSLQNQNGLFMLWKIKNMICSKRSKLDFRLVWCVKYSSSAHTAHITLDVKISVSSPCCIMYYYILFWNLRYLIEVSKYFLDGILLRNVLNFNSKYEHAYFSVWSWWGQCKIRRLCW